MQGTGSAIAHRKAIECGASPFEFGVLFYDQGSLEFNVPKVSYLYHSKCGYVPRERSTLPVKRGDATLEGPPPQAAHPHLGFTEKATPNPPSSPFSTSNPVQRASSTIFICRRITIHHTMVRMSPATRAYATSFWRTFALRVRNGELTFNLL